MRDPVQLRAFASQARLDAEHYRNEIPTSNPERASLMARWAESRIEHADAYELQAWYAENSMIPVETEFREAAE